MARDPGSLWSPLLENGRQGTYTKTQFIVHSTGDRGSAAAIFNYFNRSEVVVESTFVIGLSPADPTRQLLDSASGADANVGANRTGISVEVVGRAEDPFTDWQVSEIIRIARWALVQHPQIARRICRTATDPGFGWHVLFGAPGPWAAVAKECPGKTRISQLRNTVFPAIFAGTTPTPAPVVEEAEDDMPILVEVQAEPGLPGAYYLRDGAGYDHIVDGNTISEYMKAGAKTVKLSQREHQSFVAQQSARAAAKVDAAALAEALKQASFPTAESIAKALLDAQSSRLAA